MWPQVVDDTACLRNSKASSSRLSTTYDLARSHAVVICRDYHNFPCAAVRYIIPSPEVMEGKGKSRASWPKLRSIIHCKTPIVITLERRRATDENHRQNKAGPTTGQQRMRVTSLANISPQQTNGDDSVKSRPLLNIVKAYSGTTI